MLLLYKMNSLRTRLIGWIEEIFIHKYIYRFSSVQSLIVSGSLQPQGLQHARLLHSSPTPGACSMSCPSSWWCHPNISSSVVPISHFQSVPASESSQMSEFFASDNQSIGVLPSASVLTMNIQDGFPLGWTGWISLQSKGLPRVFLNNTVQKHQFFGTQLSSQSNSHNRTWPPNNPSLG